MKEMTCDIMKKKHEEKEIEEMKWKERKKMSENGKYIQCGMSNNVKKENMKAGEIWKKNMK